MKVIKLSNEDKKVYKGGNMAEWPTSAVCPGATTGPYDSSCHSCQ
ncbi:hypothetical protein [uncultured Flavobacterium sp.]